MLSPPRVYGIKAGNLSQWYDRKIQKRRKIGIFIEYMIVKVSYATDDIYWYGDENEICKCKE